MRKIFHIEIKSDSSHKYYGSLSALVNDNSDMKISKFTLAGNKRPLGVGVALALNGELGGVAAYWTHWLRPLRPTVAAIFSAAY